MRQRPSWSAYAAAQARLAAGVLAVADPPLFGAAGRALAGPPRVEESTVAGVPATVFRPGRGVGPWPAVLVIPGMTRRGRAHPAFRAVGRAVAAMGCLAVTAEPDGVSVGEIHPRVVEASRAAALAVTARRDARDGTIALAGVSGGATLALLLAGDESLAGRVSAVAALAPCCDIQQAMRVTTTGTYRDGERLVAYAAGTFARLVVARSVVASLPEGPDRDALRSHLLGLEDDDPDPMAAPRTWPRDTLQPPASAVLDLLVNDDPGRFDELYAGLPDVQREAVESLSAVRVAHRIEAPVEIVVGRTDKYVPLADTVAFATACPTARVTVIESLAHAIPQLGVRQLRSLGQLDAALVRALAAARARR